MQDRAPGFVCASCRWGIDCRWLSSRNHIVPRVKCCEVGEFLIQTVCDLLFMVPNQSATDAIKSLKTGTDEAFCQKAFKANFICMFPISPSMHAGIPVCLPDPEYISVKYFLWNIGVLWVQSCQDKKNTQTKGNSAFVSRCRRLVASDTNWLCSRNLDEAFWGLTSIILMLWLVWGVVMSVRHHVGDLHVLIFFWI